MSSLYLLEVDFHIASEQELDEIDKKQNKQIAKSWFKRFFIIALIVGIFMFFQIMARYSVPHMFGKSTPQDRMIRRSIYVFLIANILSYLELFYRFKITFEKDRAKIAKFKVTKKMVFVKKAFIPYKVRNLVCESEGNLVLDYVTVKSGITYSNIKVGDYVYVTQLKDLGHHEYEVIG